MRTDRLWIIGGVLCAVFMLVIGWVAVIQPQYDTADQRSRQSADAEMQVIRLRKTLLDLREKRTHLAEDQARLAAYEAALPPTDAIAALLRELQASADATGVSVKAVSVGAAGPVKVSGKDVNALPINLTAAGAAGKLNLFLDQLQLVRPRAVLINSVNLAWSTDDAAKTSTVAMSVNLQAFYAPATN